MRAGPWFTQGSDGLKESGGGEGGAQLPQALFFRAVSGPLRFTVHIDPTSQTCNILAAFYLVWHIRHLSL